MKKFIILGFVVTLLVASVALWRHFQHPSDARLGQQITGTWTGSSVLVLSPDGVFSSTWGKDDSGGRYDGTWRIEDGMLLATITNAIGKEHDPVGTIHRVKIKRLDDHHLVCEFREQTITLRR